MQMQPMAAHGGMPAPGGASVAHEITHGPSFALLRVDLQPGQTLVTEAGSMVARSSHLTMDVKMGTKKTLGFVDMIVGILIAFVRKVMGGESFFVNHFHGSAPGSVWIAPQMAGEVTHRRINPGETLILSRAPSCCRSPATATSGSTATAARPRSTSTAPS
jgi:uncharacterized protein (AIM24 family)